MNSEELLAQLVDALDDKKGIDIETVDVRHLNSFTDFFLFASGRSATQVKALADHSVERARALGVQPIGIEGREFGEWVLVDFGDIVVNAMQPTTRRFYQVERLWHGANSDISASA